MTKSASLMFPPLTVSQMRALVAVGREGGIARAAAALGQVQSAVSQQIGSLEQITGLTLVERRPGRGRTALTAEGAAVAAHAEAILARLAILWSDAVAMRAAERSRVRLGAYMSAAARIVPGLLARLARDAPEVEIALTEHDSDDDLLEEIVDGRLDLTFTTLPLPAGPFAGVELLRDPQLLLVPVGDPLAGRRRPPTLAEIAERPLIGFRRGESEDRRIERHLRDAGAEARVVLRTDNNLAIPELVAIGIGCAVLPRLALAAGADPRVVAIPLPEGVVPARRVGLCWHAERALGDATRTVVDVAREVCAALDAA